MNMGLAAVPLKNVRPYMQGWNRNNKTVKLLRKFMPRYNKKGYRAYFSLDKHAVDDKTVTAPPMHLVATLNQLGFTITDYVANRCVKKTDIDKKNEFKITGVLAKSKLANKDKLIQEINNDKKRQAVKESSKLMVVSCHPYDIIGMSTGRGWVSCMTVGTDDQRAGSYNQHVAHDLAFGTLVVYAVDADDTNINHPICRCLIKPFTDDKGNILYRRETRVYGTKVPGFDALLAKFIRVLNKKVPSGFYSLVPGLYDDGTGGEVMHRNKKKPVPGSKKPKPSTERRHFLTNTYIDKEDIGKFIEEMTDRHGSTIEVIEPDSEKEAKMFDVVAFLLQHSDLRSKDQTLKHFKHNEIDVKQFLSLVKDLGLNLDGGYIPLPHASSLDITFRAADIAEHPELISMTSVYDNNRASTTIETLAERVNSGDIDYRDFQNGLEALITTARARLESFTSIDSFDSLVEDIMNQNYKPEMDTHGFDNYDDPDELIENLGDRNAGSNNDEAHTEAYEVVSEQYDRHQTEAATAKSDVEHIHSELMSKYYEFEEEIDGAKENLQDLNDDLEELSAPEHFKLGDEDLAAKQKEIEKVEEDIEVIELLMEYLETAADEIQDIVDELDEQSSRFTNRY